MRFLLSKLRIFLFFPIPYLSQPLQLINGSERNPEVGRNKAEALGPQNYPDVPGSGLTRTPDIDEYPDG